MKAYLKENAWRLGIAGMFAVVLAFGLVDPGAIGMGMAGAFMLGEVKNVDELMTAWNAFQKANDERLKELEKKGVADATLVTKVENANQAIEKALKKVEDIEAKAKAETARADALEATLKRINASGAGGGSKVEAKHLDAYVAMYGGDVNEKNFLEHKAALHAFMRKGVAGKLPEFEAKAMSVDSNPDGGFFVLPDTSGRIVQKVFESSPMRQYAAIQGISTDALEGNYDLDEASSGWVAERQDRPETGTPQTGQWRIPTHELYAEPRATQKLLDDSQVDPEQWLAGKVSDKFARDEAVAFVTGDGNGKPRGFLTYASGVPTKGAWKVIEQVNSGAAGAFVAAPNGADVFITTMGKMKDFYLSGAIWVMNRTTRAETRKLKDSNGHYILNMDANAGFKPTIFGVPVVSFEDMPALAGNSLSIALANFSQAYQIVDRIGIRVLRDPYTAKPFIKFYTTKRVGGDVLNFEAIKIIKFAV